MHREEKWTAMVSEFGRDANIADLVEDCRKDVQEQMVMRLDEIRENYEDLKAKVVSPTTNKDRASERRTERDVRD